MRRREIGRPGHPGDSTPRRPTVRTGARSAHRPSGHARPFAGATREDRAPRSPPGCRRAGGRSRPAAPSSRSAPPRSARAGCGVRSAIVRSSSPFAAASWITWWKRSLPRTQSLSSSQRVRPRPRRRRAISVSIERRNSRCASCSRPSWSSRIRAAASSAARPSSPRAPRTPRGARAGSAHDRAAVVLDLRDSERLELPKRLADGVLLTPNSRAIALAGAASRSGSRR